MENRMTVEVQGSFGQFYPAVVTGFLDKTYFSALIGECEEVKRVDYANARLPPPPRQSPEFKFTPGEPVETFCKLSVDLTASVSANEPEVAAQLKNELAFGDAWWPAKLREVKGTFAVVLLAVRVGTPSNPIVQQHAEIVELDKVRPVNSQPSLSNKSVHRFSIALGSDDVLEFCATTPQDLHKDLRERCGGPMLISYNREDKCIEFCSFNERVILKVEMLADTHERRIRELFRIDEQSKRLLGVSLSGASVVDEFVVAQSVIGAALQNLAKARRLEGITAIEVDKEAGRFRIVGDREDAVHDARNLLEFIEVTIGVPAEYASRIIGRLGVNIQRIVDKSNVLRVSVLGEVERVAAANADEPLPSEVPFRFMGSREAIDNARMMLEYRIETLREFDRLRAGLSSGTPPTISTYTSQPIPVETNSSSGFNTSSSSTSVNAASRPAPTLATSESEQPPVATATAAAAAAASAAVEEPRTHHRATLQSRGAAAGAPQYHKRNAPSAAYAEYDSRYEYPPRQRGPPREKAYAGTDYRNNGTSYAPRTRNPPAAPAYRTGSARRNDYYDADSNANANANANTNGEHKPTSAKLQAASANAPVVKNGEQPAITNGDGPKKPDAADTNTNAPAEVNGGEEAATQRRGGNGSNARRRRRAPDANGTEPQAAKTS